MRKRMRWMAGVGIAALGISVVVWRAETRRPTGAVYVAAGYGGFSGGMGDGVARTKDEGRRTEEKIHHRDAEDRSGPQRKQGTGTEEPGSPLFQSAVEAYNAGQYKTAEAAAERVIERTEDRGRRTEDEVAERGPGLTRQTSLPASPLRGERSLNSGDSTFSTAVRPIAQKSPSSLLRPSSSVREAVEARALIAYSAAREKDFGRARDEFADVEREAAKLPDHGKPVTAPGEDPAPGLDADAAYQHANLTAAMGDKTGAEAEYVSLMRRYPESPLVQGAIKRIAWLHGGNIPPADESVWKASMKIADARQAARDRAAAVCGPECVAEILRRTKDGGRRTEEKVRGTGREARGTAPLPASGRGRGIGPGREGAFDSSFILHPSSFLARPSSFWRSSSVQALAKEMGTDGSGTTMEAMGKALVRRGFDMRGVALTWKGLTEQRLPAIALLRPGHYVIMDRVDQSGVTVWDPDLNGVGQGGTRVYGRADWARAWTGDALVAR